MLESQIHLYSPNVTLGNIIHFPYLIDAAPGHVSSFSGHSINSSCIQLSLVPPIMTGCNVISHYDLSYQSLSGGKNGFHVNKQLSITSPLTTNINVCGLKTSILYNFVIAAVNGAGRGLTTVIRIYHYDPHFK